MQEMQSERHSPTSPPNTRPLPPLRLAAYPPSQRESHNQIIMRPRPVRLKSLPPEPRRPGPHRTQLRHKTLRLWRGNHHRPKPVPRGRSAFIRSTTGAPPTPVASSPASNALAARAASLSTPGARTRPVPDLCDGYFSFVKTLSPLGRLIVSWPFAASNSKTIPGSILNLSSALASSGTRDGSAPG